MEFRASIHVARPPEAVWDAWADVARYPQWQGGVAAVRDLQGDVRAAGASYVLEAGPKMRRQVRVTAAERPTRYVMEQTGLGMHDVTTTTFEPDGDGTLVTLTLYAHLNAVLRILSRLDRRSRQEREIQRELERFAAVAIREAPPARAGWRYSVRAGAYRRHVDVTEVDGELTHLRLQPGWLPWDAPTPTTPKLPGTVPSDFHVWPLNPPMRSSLDANQHGLPFLLRDGGHGVEHLVLAASAWADALPEAAGEAALTERDRAAVAAWHLGRGPVVGVDATIDLATVVTLRLGAREDGVDVWGVAKILRSEILKVHLAVYGTTWQERPSEVDPAALRLGRMSDEAIERGDPPDPSLGIGHVPLERGAFDQAKPRFVGLVPLRQEELDGYRIWRESGASAFSTLQFIVDWPTHGSRAGEAPDEAPS
jgi:uncharacterized protein YndB with AHSA1/START domain